MSRVRGFRQAEHRQLEVEKESAEKQLKELMARFKLRKALLHWRHRKLTLSFRSLVTMVFRTVRRTTHDSRRMARMHIPARCAALLMTHDVSLMNHHARLVCICLT